MTSARQGDLTLALTIAATQIALALLLAAICFLVATTTASAVLAGGLIGVLASSSFALVSLRSAEHNSAGKILLDFYLGQVVKWIVIVIGMIVAFRFLPGIDHNLNVLVLLGAFLLTQSAYIIVPTFLKKR